MSNLKNNKFNNNDTQNNINYSENETHKHNQHKLSLGFDINYNKYISQINNFGDENFVKSNENEINQNEEDFSNKSSDKQSLVDSDVCENPISINNLEIKKPLSKKLYIGNFLYTFLLSFCTALIVVIYLLNFVITPIKVVGISMQPTINSSTYYLGNDDEEHCDVAYYGKKKSYQINDIVIVKNNGYIPKSINNDVDNLIKRVVALPNQTIKFELTSEETAKYNDNFDYEYIIYYFDFSVYDENDNLITIDQSYLDQTQRTYTTKSLISFYKNIFPIYYEIFSNVIENGVYYYTIESDEYFVMGDNRNNSNDSRFFGAVKYDDIEGSVKIIVAYNQTLLKAIIIKLKSYF